MKTIAKLKKNSIEGVKSNKAAKIVTLFSAFAGVLILIFPESDICRNIYNNLEIILPSIISLIASLVFLIKK